VIEKCKKCLGKSLCNYYRGDYGKDVTCDNEGVGMRECC